MTEAAVQIMTHNLLVAVFGLAILTAIMNFLVGILFFRNAVRRHDYDLALAILLGLYAIILAYLPDNYYLWNYLGIGWGILLFVFIFKLYFGEIIKNGSPLDIFWMIVGILLIVLIVIFAPYITLPEWMNYIPAI